MKTKKLAVSPENQPLKPRQFADLHPRPSYSLPTAAPTGSSLALACCGALFLTGSLAGALFFIRTLILKPEITPPVSVVASPSQPQPEVVTPPESAKRVRPHVPKMPTQARPPTPNRVLPPTPPPPKSYQIISTQSLVDESIRTVEMLEKMEAEEAAELARKEEEERLEKERLAKLESERKEQERLKAIERAKQAEIARKEREIREAKERQIAAQREVERKRLAEIAARENAVKQERARQLAARENAARQEQARQNAAREAAARQEQARQLAAQRSQQEAQRRLAEEERKKRQAAAEYAELSKKLASYPSLTKKVPPKYPTSARKAGLQGTVKISVTVTSSGRVSSPRIIASSGNSTLDSSALSSVKKYRFHPAKNALGKSIAYSGVIVPITFRLN